MKQPEALRLADALDGAAQEHSLRPFTFSKAATELRRLHEVNQELLEALARYVQQDVAHSLTDNNLHRTACVAIAKAEEQE